MLENTEELYCEGIYELLSGGEASFQAAELSRITECRVQHFGVLGGEEVSNLIA